MTCTGFGTDVHFFTDDPARLLVLGGFPVAGHKGVEADSDGDIALHALCNALSASVGGKSLGFYVNKLSASGIHDSKRYVALIHDNLKSAGYKVDHVSLAFECVTPRIDPLGDGIRTIIADLLSLEPSHVGITASQGDRYPDRIRVSAVITVSHT